MNRLHTVIAGGLYVLFFFLLFQQYQLYIDPDGISYIKAAERLAAGHFTDGINGYWSPLSSFLLAPFIKLGLNPVLASKYINGMLGLLCLFSFQKLFSRFRVNRFIQTLLPYTAAILLLSFCFYELCADLPALLILSVYLNIVFTEKFYKSWLTVLLVAVCGVLGYFAKAYTFYFFLLHVTVVLWYVIKKDTGTNFSVLFIQKWVAVIVIFILAVAPYIHFISKKYGHFTINTAGTLNASWVLEPGYTDSARLIIPPPYPGAVSNWDDPSFQQKATVNAFTSKKHFIKQLRVTGYNIFTFSKLITAFSVTGIPALLIFFLFSYFFNRENNVNHRLLFFTACLMPAGYVLIIIEDRYIWLTQMLLLLITAIILSSVIEYKKTGKAVYYILSVIILLSFCKKPVSDLLFLSGRGKYEQGASQALKANNINGKFFIKADNSSRQASVSSIAYLTQSQLTGAYKMPFSKEEVKAEIAQNNIQYILQLYERDQDKKEILNPDFSQLAVKIYDSIYPGLIVYKMHD